MATVTGMTAEAMAAIRDGTVVSAAVVGDHLILTKHDGTTVDAGNVRGPQGNIGPAGLSLSSVPLASVLDVGMVNQIRAGRQLTVADFTTVLGLPTNPVGLFNLGDLTNLGSGPALVNKGAVPFATGITGAAAQAAQFSGSTGQVLYIVDAGSSDPFRLKTGMWGCWFRTAKRGTSQMLLTKWNDTGNLRSIQIYVDSATNAVTATVSRDGVDATALQCPSDVADDRWHHLVVTYDGTFVKVYVDGVLDGTLLYAGGLFGSSAPFNVGGRHGDGSNASDFPFFGRIDEAFVSPDVPEDDQVRLLYCTKIAHGLGAIPKNVILHVHRRRKGVLLASADFPSAPVRLHNLNDLNDLGSGAVALTANPGTGAINQVTGPDGSKDSARQYIGAHTGDSSTDTGLPAGTASRTLSAWFKTASVGSVYGVLGYGTVGTGEAFIFVDSTGTIRWQDGPNAITGPVINDGRWHHVAVVIDNAALDGQKAKLYLDGKLVAANTLLAGTTLVGANRFRVGARTDGTTPMVGTIGRVYVHSAALTTEQIRSLMFKSGQDLGPSPKNAGDHVEAFDGTNLYATFDTIDAQHQIDLAVAA